MPRKLLQLKSKLEGFHQTQRTLRAIQDPKKRKPAIKSMGSAGAVPVVKELRKVIKSNHVRYGFLTKSIGSKVKVYSNGVLFVAAGVDRRKKFTHNGKRIVPSKIFHLVDLGTKSHMQPNAHRWVGAEGFRVSVPVGPRQHPGTKAGKVRIKALRRSRGKAAAAMAKRARKRYDKDASRLRKLTSKANPLHWVR